VSAGRQLTRGTLYVALGQGSFLVTGFLLHAVLARWLPAAAYGIFNVAMTLLVWVEITVNNGVPSALSKFLPDETLSEKDVLRSAARVQALVSVAVLAVMFLAAPLLALLLRDPALTGYLRLALVDVVAMAAYAYYRGVLNGWRFFRQMSLAIMAYSFAKLVAISLLVGLGFGIEGALVGNVLASLGGLVAGYFWTRRRQRAASSQPDNGSEAASPRLAVDGRQILAFVLPTIAFTLSSNVLLGFDLMQVQALLPGDLVGYYSAAVKLAEAPRLVLLAFTFTLLPSLSHAIAAGDQARARHYLEQTIRLLALVLLPLIALVTATAEGALTFVFPAEYQAAAPILSVLILAYTAYAVYITLVTTLLAENRPRRALLIPLVVLPLEGTAIWLGITYLGAIGAALASLASVAVAAAVVLAYVHRRYRPAAGARSLVRIALASAAIWGIARWWAPSGLALVLAYGLLAALYVALLLLLGELRARDLGQVGGWLLPRKDRN
jgi:O-antigen/teichoic acid export membrane protein